MESALDLLRSTIQSAQDYINEKEPTRPFLRFYIKAVQEDMDLLATVASDCVEPHQKSLELGIEARQIKRRLELLLMALDPFAQSSSHESAANVATLETMPTSWRSPALKTPSFNGDAIKFPAYRNILLENVINNPNMTASSKWAYLRDSLSGPPADLISEIPEMPEMLKVAFKLLDDVYGRKEKVAAKLHEKLVSLPKALPVTESMRMTHAKLEGILLSMSLLNCPMSDNIVTRGLYTAKFPPDEIGFEKLDIEKSTLQTIRDEISHLLLVREVARQ